MPRQRTRRYAKVRTSEKKVKLIEIILTIGGLLIAATAINNKFASDSFFQELYGVSLFGFILFSFIYYYCVSSKHKISKDILANMIRFSSGLISLFLCVLMIMPVVVVIANGSISLLQILIGSTSLSQNFDLTLVVALAFTYASFIVAFIVIFKVLMNETTLIRVR